MGLVTSKAPNPRETDVNDPRYTDLNRFNKNAIRTIVGGQDVMLGGINVIGIGELQVRAYLEEGVKAEIGDTVLMGNRVGTISAVEYDASDPDIILNVTIIERDIPQPNDASAQDLLDNLFIGQNTRQTVLFLGLEAGGTTDDSKLFGGTNAYLFMDVPTVIKKKGLLPETWNPIAQAMRKYQGTVPVTVTVDVYTDNGTTQNGAGDVTFTPVDSINGAVVVTAVAGTIDAILEPGVIYGVTDGDTAASEVQETASDFFTPADIAGTQTCTIWNYVA